MSDADDTDNYYRTYWLAADDTFQSQNCTVSRALGGNDIGGIKLKPNVDYKVHLGAKTFYTVNSAAALQADSAAPYIMNLEYSDDSGANIADTGS